MTAKKIVLIVGLILGALIFAYLCLWGTNYTKKPIKVGILHSLSGSAALSEKPLVDATLLAVDEINQQGGILGRRIEPIIIDGKSDIETFKKGALSLIKEHQVAVIFGVWLSSIRKALKPIVEQHNMLLFYPAGDEGLEESTHIVGTGFLPNQVIMPAINWSFYNLGKTFFLVGADTLYSYAINHIVRLYVQILGGSIVGEQYIKQDAQVPEVVQKIIAAKPAVIINSISSTENLPFFKLLRSQGITAERIPVMSFGISEVELKYLEVPFMAGDYAASNYFQTLRRKENIKFINRFKKKYGKQSVVNNEMQTAYTNVYLWRGMVKAARSFAVSALLPHIKDQIFNGPGGIVYLDENNRQWSATYIGKIQYDGQFDIIWGSNKQIKPLIYPPFQSKEYWHTYVTNVQKKLGES